MQWRNVFNIPPGHFLLNSPQHPEKIKLKKIYMLYVFNGPIFALGRLSSL